jgi:hypothetical protein
MHNFPAPPPPQPVFWETPWGIGLMVVGIALIALRIWFKKVRGI